MSSSGRGGGQRGRGGKDGGGSADRQSSTRGRSRSSRSGRSNRGPKQSTASSRGSPAPVSESLSEQSLSSSTLPPPPSPAAGTGRREDGLVPGAGLLALQALAAAQNKTTVGTDGTVGSAIPAAVAKAAEKAVAGGGNGGVTREEGRGGGGGGKNRGKARASGGGGFSGKDTGFKGRGSASAEGRGGAVAAVAAAAITVAKTAPLSRGRGKGGVDDGRGRSTKVSSGVKKDSSERSGRPQLSEVEQRKRSEESKKALAAQQEQRKRAEEERRRKAEEDRRAREEQRARREAEERERKRRAEADARKKELEQKKALETRKRLEEKRKKAEEVRRKAEEEAARKEEEARRKEEEKRRETERLRLEEARAVEEEKRQKEAEQERARREFEAQMEAVSQLDQLRKEEQARWELRAKHTPAALKASREAHEASKSKLKSDLKRTTAFTKKVKTLSEDQRSSLTKEVEGLNLSRYVSEVADAVAENRLKSSDVPVAVHLCCLMHQRYGEFADDLVPKLAAPLLSPALEDEREEKENLRRKRSSLRLLTELHASGVFDGSRLIAKIVQSLCGQDTKEKRRQRPTPSSGDLRRRDQPTVTAVPPPLREGDVVLLAAFVRTAGEDMIGVLQRKTVNMLQQAGEMAKLEREPIVDADVKDRLRSLVDGVFDSLCSHLERAHEQMGRLEKKMERDRLTNGSLTDEKEKNLEESRKAYEALLGNVSSLASSLNRDMPQLPEEEDEEEAGGISLWEGGVGDRSGYTGPFEESERSFYEDLPDLLNTYPPNLLGLTEEEAEKLREEERAKQKERASTNAEGPGAGDGETEGGQVVESGDDALAEEMKGLALGDGEERGVRGGDEEADAGGGHGKGDGGASEEEEYGGKNGGGTGEGEGDGDDAEEGGDHVTRNARLTLMLEDELPNCHNQERVDEFAKNFCYVNSKGARKKLVAALFNVPRQALDLLPMYSRLVAILDKAMKTIAPSLLDELKSHFRYFLRKKAPGQIDHRIKNVRYMGELVKFRVAAPVVAFHCLKACLDDFSSGAVQTMCSLLETCGRFLFRQKLTHQRTKNFLTVMMRIKKAKNLDSRLEALIDNAFYTCCPPERPQRAAKVRTPLQLYVRHLMMERLRDDAEVVEGVIKQLRKLPWQDPEANVESEVLRASLRLCRSRYPCIHLAADVLSGLARYQDRVAVKVVDMMLEELRRGIELPGRGRDSQRLVGYARLLAELYNYAVVGSPTIFETLHLLLDSGHEVPMELKQPRPADPKNPTKALMMPPPLPPWARFDPRIPSPTDPPGDCLRIRLVVSILEGCGSYFVRGGGLTKLSKFLSVFQRYLFCKERLPAGTEFAVLDLVEDLEAGARAARDRDRAKSQESTQEGKGSSKGKGRGRKGKEEEDADDADNGPILPRHRSWEDAQAAVLEADRAWDEDNSRRMAKIAKLLGKEKAEAGNDGCDGDDDDDDDDEREEDDEEEEEDDRRGSGSEGEEGGLEDDAAKRGGKRATEEASEGVPTDEAEDDVVLHGGGRAERTEEDGAADEEFEALLSKTMSESVEKTKIARATTQVMGHMAVPMVLKNTNVKRATQETPLTGGTGVAFKLLKRGNKGKMEAQEVMVPATTSLAMQVSRNEEANREENSIIKARVLAYEANMEEAILAQESGTVPLPEDYTQFIPKVHNAPLHHPEGGKAGGKGGGGRGGGKKR